MPEFFQTVMGQRFYEGTMPRIAKALEEIAKELKRANDMREKAEVAKAPEDLALKIDLEKIAELTKENK
jgi:hypothetical protein